MATRSLPRNNPSFYIAGAAITLALMRTRPAVKDGLRRKGEKVSAYPSCEITTMAKAYLADHADAELCGQPLHDFKAGLNA